MKKKKNNMVKEEILTYEFHRYTYVFNRDGKFTTLMVFSSNTGKFVGMGYAFCSRGDKYLVETGCHMALNRFLSNTGAGKCVKRIVHENLAKQLELMYLKSILVRIMEEENERIN